MGMFETDARTEKGFYIAGWCVIAFIPILWGIETVTGIRFLRMLPPCMLHAMTGYYCPGCGGTRAVTALFHGDLLRSAWCHPFVPYAALTGVWFMVSQTIERLTRGRVKIGLRYREVYIWIALGLILVNFAVKNAAILLWGVDLLK